MPGASSGQKRAPTIEDGPTAAASPPSMPPPSQKLKRTLILGAAWQVGTRWSIRGLGFINTIIMARILAPHDYGIVALATLVVGAIQAVIDFGPGTSLLRKAEIARPEIDSAWTLMVLQGLAAAAILLALSLPAAWYFNDARLGPILATLAACILFASVSNIGPTLALKNYDFAVNFKAEVAGKVISIAATIGTGLWLRDYRALVIGIAAGYVAGTLFSYLLHEYRPRWCTSCLREIWDFGKWMTVSSLGTFVLRKGDELIAGKLSNAQDFGLYHVGSDVGQMPVAEVGPALLRALLPILSTLKEDAERTNAAVIKTIAALNGIIWPIGLGTSALAHPFAYLLLGPQWVAAAHFVAGFALVAVLQTAGQPLRTLLTLHGVMKLQGTIVWVELAVFCLASALLVPIWSLAGLMFARMASSLVCLLVLAGAARKHCGLSVTAALAAMARPMLGAVIMFGVVRWATDGMESVAAQLATGIPLGAVFYGLWSFATWWAIGKPEGLESTIMDRA
jgi:O-antigen/teichoic acid export membrane protein